jgi:hypothetical protein
VTGLDDLVTAYQTLTAELVEAEDPEGPGWSPIRAECVAAKRAGLAVEIANLIAVGDPSDLHLTPA